MSTPSFPCRRLRPLARSRRQVLREAACGFGALAFAALADREANGARAGSRHHRAQVEHVIFLYMDGGVSQVDSFDPKPRLERENGQPFGMNVERTQFDNNGKTLASPWRFRRYGESGLPISDLFPHIARHADRLCVLRSMTSVFSEHTSANYFLHTGHGQVGRPSMGAWMTYGLGSECDDLPGYVVLDGGLTPPGGLDNFAAGFLPASHQASVLRPSDPPLPNLRSAGDERRAAEKRSLLAALDRRTAERWHHPDAVEAAVANYEMAFRMQTAVPELIALDGETTATHRRYGTDSEYRPTATYARQCLLARRLVERGVRFIELTCPGVGADRWDQHSGLRKGHADNARAVDQPIAALLDDLRERGLWDRTLVVFTGEFGRTPFAQGSDGRDHNPFGFSLWMAGGGVRGGVAHGRTDEYGYKVVQHPLEIHDLHATMLHLMGIDHRRLTHRFGGRDMRLTDVHGHVIHPVLTAG